MIDDHQPPTLEARGLTKNYSGFTAVRDVSSRDSSGRATASACERESCLSPAVLRLKLLDAR
jgi:hypothetical protein